jgi:hypothetical protein
LERREREVAAGGQGVGNGEGVTHPKFIREGDLKRPHESGRRRSEAISGDHAGIRLIYRKGSLKLYLTVDAELTASGTVYFARKQWGKEEAFLPEGRFGDVVECSR